MELTFSHKNIKTTLKSRTVHTKQLLNACGRSRTSEKMRKPPHNQVGQQEKEKEGIWVEPAPQGGKLWRRKGSLSWPSLLRWGDQTRLDRAQASEPRRRAHNWFVEGKTEHPAQVSTAILHFPAWDTRLSLLVGAGCGSSGFWVQTQGEDWDWLGCGKQD